jgi:hypothetical protein
LIYSFALGSAALAAANAIETKFSPRTLDQTSLLRDPSSLNISFTTSCDCERSYSRRYEATDPGIDLTLVSAHLCGDMLLEDGSQSCCAADRRNPGGQLGIPA